MLSVCLLVLCEHAYVVWSTDFEGQLDEVCVRWKGGWQRLLVRVVRLHCSPFVVSV